MEVTGLNGNHGAVIGIVDSGADTSAFPLGYAALMGYDNTTLDLATTITASGTASCHVANQTSSMAVAGLPGGPVIPITPTSTGATSLAVRTSTTSASRTVNIHATGSIGHRRALGM